MPRSVREYLNHILDETEYLMASTVCNVAGNKLPVLAQRAKQMIGGWQ
jgi:hypothetical protein